MVYVSPPPLNIMEIPSSRFIVPISIVICNDIMAYLFGFFFGRTPLIKVNQHNVLCCSHFRDLHYIYWLYYCLY